MFIYFCTCSRPAVDTWSFTFAVDYRNHAVNCFAISTYCSMYVEWYLSIHTVCRITSYYRFVSKLISSLLVKFQRAKRNRARWLQSLRNPSIPIDTFLRMHGWRSLAWMMPVIVCPEVTAHDWDLSISAKPQPDRWTSYKYQQSWSIVDSDRNAWSGLCLKSKSVSLVTDKPRNM